MNPVIHVIDGGVLYHAVHTVVSNSVFLPLLGWMQRRTQRWCCWDHSSCPSLLPFTSMFSSSLLHQRLLWHLKTLTVQLKVQSGESWIISISCIIHTKFTNICQNKNPDMHNSDSLESWELLFNYSRKTQDKIKSTIDPTPQFQLLNQLKIHNLIK